MIWTIDTTQIELLAKCNLKCRHCSNATQNVDSELSPQAVKKIVDQLATFDVKTVVLSGGEPFLYHPLAEIVDYIYSKNIMIQINTNGVLLSTHISWLEKYKRLLTLQVSMDGYDALTYKFIRNSNSFDSVVDNILGATALGINVEMKAVLSKQTAPHYQLFQALSEKLNARITYGYIARQGRAIGNENAICLLPTEIIESFKEMTHDGIMTVQKGIFKSDRCPLIFSPGTIGAMRITNEGDCYPCIGFSGHALILGNIFEHSIHEMLNDYNSYRKLLLDMIYNKQCLLCGARRNSPRPGCIVSCKYFGNTICGLIIEGEL